MTRMPMTDRPVKLSCRNVWKVFGREAERFLQNHSTPTADQIADAGLLAAVRDVSLDIHDGEIFIVMGLSGSGKSTLLRCLSRLIEPSAGSILLDGDDLLKADEARLIDIRRHKMGMVFQNFALLPHLSVLENVAFPLSVQNVGKVERLRRAMEVIELVGLKGREQSYPRQLSGGQQQRVGIARSLAVNPELWFLDEPFSALDPLIRREMQSELLRLQNVLKKTMVFVTHDFDEAIRLADRIAIMKDGAVIQTGTPEELVTNPATDYVAEFTRDVQRAKVVSAASAMQPPSTGHFDSAVAADLKIQAVAAQVIGGGKPVAVTAADGSVIGELTPDAVLTTLIGREAHR
ncbi:glycine betaine/L-proline ABC transporter ATP-binding protein [Dongia soli]|uniref:Quaternary amine transport ATP-binding protein n=1 Tax=Dongia soli TaxID=600628 RepID=A0ABU5EBM4_9PROT|nr:glycine betaine/L-proline ABC transporter ATP-binding protein [Dongia soli]MDY0883282.1 glycine betaine/L-proline ABC transporter ATP-binding protein [Dongia soli]